MSTPPFHLGWTVAGALVGLSLVGCGLYAVVPLVQDPEDEARAVVTSYVRAWGERRCDDAAGLIDGPRQQVLAACASADRPAFDALQVEVPAVSLDGDHGTVTVRVRYRDGGQDRTREVAEAVVLVDGTWKVRWAPAG